MTIKQAIEYVAEGHSEYSVQEAKKICQAFKLKLPNYLIDRWKNQKEANPTNDPKGLWLYADKPGEGVSSFRLSMFIVASLGLKTDSYFGRGSQARENAAVIKKHFNIA